MAGQRVLESFRNQQRALAIIYKTGQFQRAFNALGMSRKSFKRFRDAHPDFNEECLFAKQAYEVQRQIERNLVKLRVNSLKELTKRVTNGSARDRTLLTLLLGTKYRYDLPFLPPLLPPVEDETASGQTVAAQMLAQVVQDEYTDLDLDTLVTCQRALVTEKLTGDAFLGALVNALAFLDEQYDPTSPEYKAIDAFLQRFNHHMKVELASLLHSRNEADKLPD